MPNLPSENRPLRPPTADELREAASAVSRHLEPTPLIESARRGLWLKLETFQPTGSFKVRGAITALGSVPHDEHVVTASAGNHGLGMAYAAQVMNREVSVVVPENASHAKVSALRTYPITLIQHGRSCYEAEAYAMNLIEERGGTYISPYNDARVVAGQSTIGIELADMKPSAVVCAVGGGGLCAGLATWGRSVDVPVFGIEVDASLAISSAIQHNGVVPITVRHTAADGLAGQLEPSTFTWSVIRNSGVTMKVVDDIQIVGAMRWLYENHGLVVEASGATALAAILSDIIDAPQNTVVVVSGRNISRSTYCKLIND